MERHATERTGTEGTGKTQERSGLDGSGAERLGAEPKGPLALILFLKADWRGMEARGKQCRAVDGNGTERLIRFPIFKEEGRGLARSGVERTGLDGIGQQSTGDDWRGLEWDSPTNTRLT